MVSFAVAASDLGTGVPNFVVFLVPAPRTRRICFQYIFTVCPFFKTFLAASWPFINILDFSFCVFSRDFHDYRWFFFI